MSPHSGGTVLLSVGRGFAPPCRPCTPRSPLWACPCFARFPPPALWFAVGGFARKMYRIKSGARRGGSVPVCRFASQRLPRSVAASLGAPRPRPRSTPPLTRGGLPAPPVLSSRQLISESVQHRNAITAMVKIITHS